MTFWHFILCLTVFALLRDGKELWLNARISTISDSLIRTSFEANEFITFNIGGVLDDFFIEDNGVCA